MIRSARAGLDRGRRDAAHAASGLTVAPLSNANPVHSAPGGDATDRGQGLVQAPLIAIS
ncbi:MAG: hypothetical protein H5U18_14980 [Rhodobacteraceae bacterium]|nr:hypothetical protein [Paracoccaceae bacterium]